MKLLFIISLFLGSFALANEPADAVTIDGTYDNGLVIEMPTEGDAFRISGINTLEIKSIEVFDRGGKLVGEIDQSQIDENGAVSVDHFNDGTYTLSIIFDDKEINRTIVIG